MSIKSLWSVYIKGNLGPVGELNTQFILIGLVASDFYYAHPKQINKSASEEM